MLNDNRQHNWAADVFAEATADEFETFATNTVVNHMAGLEPCLELLEKALTTIGYQAPPLSY